MKKSLLWMLDAILTSSLLLTACYNDDIPVIDSAPTVVCTNGVFIGKQEGHVMAYKGIPYAVPPVGALRWKAPWRWLTAIRCTMPLNLATSLIRRSGNRRAPRPAKE